MCSSDLVLFTGGFEHGLYLNLGFLFIPFVFFVVLGTDNGVNFTDGLDGLCTSVTILVATFLTIISIGENSGISPITGAVVGSLLGFLLFNVYPAGRFCISQRIHDADSAVHPHHWFDLPGGGAVSYHAGVLF